jgi:hypothetical protein
MKGIFILGFILSLWAFGCGGGSNVSAEINEGASLAGELPANPLQWNLITSETNKPDLTTSTLFGNDVAVRYARTNSQHSYPSGSVLSLVTWTQREDPRWFGARIPARVKSVEFVFVEVAPDRQPAYYYQRFEGAPLKKTSAEEGLIPNKRAAYLLSQKAAVLP